MADISKVTLPSGTEYNLKDAWAREQLADVSKFTKFLGVTTTELTDGASTNPITINGSSVTAANGNMVTYGNKEFIFNGSIWQEFGDATELGDLAYKDTASGTFTPSGSISVSSAGTTSTIHNPTAETVAKTIVSAAPGATAPTNPVTYYSVANETLSLYQLGYTTGDSITTSDVTVKTGDASYSFTGTEDTVTVS